MTLDEQAETELLNRRIKNVTRLLTDPIIEMPLWMEIKLKSTLQYLQGLRKAKVYEDLAKMTDTTLRDQYVH